MTIRRVLGQLDDSHCPRSSQKDGTFAHKNDELSARAYSQKCTRARYSDVTLLESVVYFFMLSGYERVESVDNDNPGDVDLTNYQVRCTRIIYCTLSSIYFPQRARLVGHGWMGQDLCVVFRSGSTMQHYQCGFLLWFAIADKSKGKSKRRQRSFVDDCCRACCDAWIDSLQPSVKHQSNMMTRRNL